MRILHISKYYYPYIGGVENICKYLAEKGKEQTAILCFNDKCKDQIDEVNGIKVYRVATWINIARQALSLSYFPMMRKAIKEFKPDIIHFHWANPYPAVVLLTMIPKNINSGTLAHGYHQTGENISFYQTIRNSFAKTS